MSGRFKRHLSKASTSAGEGNGSGGNASGAMARKKRRLENVSSDDEERSFWTPKHLGDLKAYNRSASEAPAELFRKDLISAMKLADNEPLTPDDFWGITDQWKQEWERGVQVPVNPDSLPEPSIMKIKDYPRPNADFRLPRRYIRVTHNDFFNNEKHVLSNLPTKAEKMCRYDMDNLDEAWLKSYNGERARMGAEPVPQYIFELILEHLEETCWENIQKLLKTEETLAIEFDEDVICDVCRSPDREEGNEMVFCDICNICVHQACYGITAIPSGSWHCRTCSLGIKPNCDLCPNKGGAMKSTKSGHKWAHVACALWIPEVSIGSVERMEPITKIANIPQSRWALVCVLCRERRGACIQCSVKSCKTAYHVTCAFKHGLEMKAIIEDENADDVKLRSYCEKHSMTGKKDNSDGDSDSGLSNTQKKKRDLTNEQKNQARAAKLRQIEAEFFNHVDVLQTSTFLDIDFETTETIFYYWKLKRRGGFNKPLLTPRSQELDLLSQQQEDDLERMKMFVQLRQYLERVRNLCYMVSRREKLSRTLLKTREQTFLKQVDVLGDPSIDLTPQEISAISQANHGNSIYDRIFSHSHAPVHTPKQFDNILKLITNSCGTTSNTKVKDNEILEKKKNAGTKLNTSKLKKVIEKDVNGIIKKKKSLKSEESEGLKNPYRKTYFNGAEERRSRSRSLSNCDSSETSSTEDSDSSLASTKWKPPDPGGRISVFTSSEDEKILNKKSCISSNKSKSLFEFSPSKSNAWKESPLEESNIKSGRGRGAGRRGRGRPPSSRVGSRGSYNKENSNSLFNCEDDDKILSKESKVFDALIRSSNLSPKKEPSSSPFKKEVDSSKPYADSTDDNEDKKKSVTKVTRGRGARKLIKQEPFSSSEDETPVRTPIKRGKTRGRGRGSCRKTGTSANPLSSWSYLPTDEDDNLGPATYKLTSDEEEEGKSDKSNAVNEVLVKKDLFGASSDNKSDISENESSPTKNKKEDVRPTKSSESEKSGSEDNKESDEESLSHSNLKTKAAMKEFTPKLEAKVEKLNKKRGDKIAKTSKSSTVTVTEKKSEQKVSTKTDASENSSMLDAEPGHDLPLFVPQRAAAKKASELITSQNTGVVTNQMPVHSVLPQEGSDQKKHKSLKDSIETDTSTPSDDISNKKPMKSRRGRSSKERQVEEKQEVKLERSEESEPPKKNIFEPPEILPYVPIREAARKAAENLKGGVKTGAGVSTLQTSEDTDSPALVTNTPSKQKKNSKSDVKSVLLRSPRTKSLRNSSKTYSAESDSEAESSLSSVNRRMAKENIISESCPEKGRSIFSESEDESLLTPKKEKLPQERNVELEKDIPNKQQLFRGDIFLRDHQSSSENEDELKEKDKTLSSGREAVGKISKEERKRANKNIKSKSSTFRSSRNITRLFGEEDPLDQEHETENEEPPVETRRKAPDKKLKTSDGRPEHGFQPPVTQRNESRTPSFDKSANKTDGLKPSNEEGEQRLRESGSKSRQGTPCSDVTDKNITSDTDASFSIRKPRTGFEGVTSQGERECCEKERGGRNDEKGERSKEEIIDKGAEVRESIRTKLDRGKIQFEEPVECQQQPKITKESQEKSFKSSSECMSSSAQEETSLVKDTTTNASSNIINFSENEVKVKRLEDIEEASDLEPEPKKVKITDSDEETLSLAERKVEQPKDSGYKSAIATPEPVDRFQSVVNENENSPNSGIINEQIPIDVNLSLKKTRLQQLSSPSQSKNSSTRYTSPGRRKNLEDVIEERKKIAEQSEFLASSLVEKRSDPPRQASPKIMEHETDSLSNESVTRTSPQVAQLPICGTTSTGSSVCSTSSAPSSFVEEWREQWVKSPQPQPVQMDHIDPPAPFPLSHHPSLYPYLDMQSNHFPTSNLSMYISQYNMMHLAFLQQQYVMPPKPHDSQLEDDVNLKPDSRSFSKHGDQQQHPSRMVDPLPKLKLHQHESKKIMGIPSPKERHVIEVNKSLSIIPPNTETPIPSSDSVTLSSKCSPNTSSATSDIRAGSVGSLAVSQCTVNNSDSTKSNEIKSLVVSQELKTSTPPPPPPIPSISLNNFASSSHEAKGSAITAKSIDSTLVNHKAEIRTENHEKSSLSIVNHVQTTLSSEIKEEVSTDGNKKKLSKSYSDKSCENITTNSASSETKEKRRLPDRMETRHEREKSLAFENRRTTRSQDANASLKVPGNKSYNTSAVTNERKNLPQIRESNNILNKEVPVCQVFDSTASTPTVTTTSSNKLSTVTSVSPSRTTKYTHTSSNSLLKSDYKVHHSSSLAVVSTKSITTTTVTSVLSSTCKTVCAVSSAKITSPLPSSGVQPSPAVSPSKGMSPQVNTVDTSALYSPPQKRIPIYMQEPKTPKNPEKRSPRNIATSPRWSNKERRDRKGQSRSGRSNKNNRGRGTTKGKKKGSAARYNSVSVPKELLGTVYEFDDEFEDDGPANNALDDLRMLREKRQSVDTAPPQPPLQQSLTPTYVNEPIKDQPPKKRVKEKKAKSSHHKDKTPKREEVDEVAKILEDYRNQQNSTLKRSVHEQSPPQGSSPIEIKKHLSPAAEVTSEVDPLALEDNKSYSKPSVISPEERKKPDTNKNIELASATFTASPVVSTSVPEDRTNQLKLKIKGPYANSYLSSNLPAPTQETSVNPIPPSTTTTLRRMRKKELIMQYCHQESTDQVDTNAVNNLHNPPQQLRTGITFPKAVASMTSIPTREDYKMYTQDDSFRGSNSGRRRRQPRELKQLDWTLNEDSKNKRNSETVQESGRKRVRSSKESQKQGQEDKEKGMLVTGKLRISLGKKGNPEVGEVTNVPPSEPRLDLSSKGKPPKKRHDDIFSRVMSESLKFREEVMANFDRKGKAVSGEKKSRKRKFGIVESGSSVMNSEIKEESANEGSQKIVLKISKNKSESGSSGTEDRGGVGGGGLNTNKPCNPSKYPLKIRLNLANLSKGDSESSKEKEGSPKPSIMPLKIKFQRRPEGYITSKSSSSMEEESLDRGPGPPPEPPDPPLKPKSPSPSFHLTDADKATSFTPSVYNNASFVHKDQEESLLPPKNKNYSKIPDDVIQRLEAQLAATDGAAATSSAVPFHLGSHPPPPVDPPHHNFTTPTSFSALQPLPTLKDESGCR